MAPQKAPVQFNPRTYASIPGPQPQFRSLLPPHQPLTLGKWLWWKATQKPSSVYAPLSHRTFKSSYMCNWDNREFSSSSYVFSMSLSLFLWFPTFFSFFCKREEREKGSNSSLLQMCRWKSSTHLHIEIRFFFSQYVPFTGLTSSGTVLFVTYTYFVIFFPDQFNVPSHLCMCWTMETKVTVSGWIRGKDTFHEDGAVILSFFNKVDLLPVSIPWS